MTAHKGLDTQFALNRVHMRWLQQAAAEKTWPAPGVITAPAYNGYGRKAWRDMMRRLCREGYFAAYVHGGYEITPKGRAALQPDLDKQKGKQDGIG